MPTLRPDDRPRLSPAVAFYLMAGRYADARLPGWVKFLQTPLTERDAFLVAAWEAHAEPLMAEARAHGFEPWGATGRPPRGPAAAAWARDFQRLHEY